MIESAIFGNLKHSLVALFVVCSLVLCVHAQDDQSGFISIDCGRPESSGSYSESSTGINYISDEPFINAGVSETISPKSQSGYPKHLIQLRAFPDGIRNCYTVNVSKGTSYLIRATFYYGNYDGKNTLPGFELHVGANFWDTVTFFTDGPARKEIVHIPFQDYVRICLANNGTGTPFISALELRPLVDNTYVTESGSLELWWRTDLGSVTNKTYRYPDDALDRRWFDSDINNLEPNWTTISTTSNVNPGLNYKPPSVVMSTAIKPTNASEPLEYNFYGFQNKVYYAYLHFAEIEKLEANESRSFDIFLNGELFRRSVVPDYLNSTTIYSKSPLPVTKLFSKFSLVRRENSTLPPILNAIEIYTVLDLSQWETNEDEVQAITMIKAIYGVKRNWDGDPCAPMKYKWTGLSCGYQGSDPPRITALNLSSSGLTGEITPYLVNLTMLEYLDLSNNGLNGTVPKFLPQLSNLKVLNLEKNNFTGSVPAELIEKSKKGLLALSFDNPSGGENTNELCSSSPCEKKKKNNVIIPIVASSGGLVLLLLAVATILIFLKRKKKLAQARATTIQNSIYGAKKRQFTYSEVINITNNFERVLGRGGFGTVYHGFIGDVQVAVKKLSHSTSHGYRQFQAEVKLLMTVHHRNLTSLVGYCIEGTNMALIYEYMKNGDFDSHLIGNNNANILSWEERLQITLDSAQGLEYLHHGCKPPIVHRDIKTTNILLTDNFQAKLADFGLSRSFPTEGETHVSTVVAGTPGYLDPEYSTTNRLTEYSDVYSFGVVLLQIITSRCAILIRGNERIHISQWVSSMLSNGDVKNIVDQQLKGEFDTNSVWKVVEIAMASVSPNSSRRPNMSQVVSELKECLAAESARRNYAHQTDSSNSTEVLSTNTMSEFSYIPR